MTKLRALNLSGNSLTGTIPSQLSAATGMRILDLSDNSLSGALPFTVFQNMNLMKVLNLADNSFTGSISTSLPTYCPTSPGSTCPGTT